MDRLGAHTENDNETISLENQIFLIRLQNQCNGYIESYKLSTDFARMAHRGGFILNGAAIIAILAKENIEKFEYTIYWLVAGVLCAITATSFAFIFHYAETKKRECILSDANFTIDNLQEIYNIGRKNLLMSNCLIAYFLIASYATVLSALLQYFLGGTYAIMIFFIILLISIGISYWLVRKERNSNI